MESAVHSHAAAPVVTPNGRPLDSFDLPEPVREGIRAAGFTHCTPIQDQVLPLSLAGRLQTLISHPLVIGTAFLKQLVRRAPSA